jgi:L-fuculose-phosphate aldolase
LIHTFTQRAFGDVRVVVHTHSVFAVAVAVIGQNVPPIVDEMTILLGGGLDVAPYAAPGSEELARNAVKTMGDHRAVLLANHGAVVTGADPQEALKMAEMVEHVAQIFLLAKTAGKVCSIPDSVYEKQRGIYLKKRGVFFNGSFDKS